MLARISRWLVGAFFLVAGVAKAFDADGFAKKISDFGLVHEAYLGSAAWALIVAEISVGVACFARPKLGLRAAIALLFLFLAVLGYGIAIGLDVDCGCLPFGLYESLQAAVVRDLVLLAFSVLGLLGSTSLNEGPPRT